MSNKKIAVIIVNYNTIEYTKELLKSLSLIKRVVQEVIVIDNDSDKFFQPISKEFNIKTIVNKKNLGFAKAVNQGIKNSKTELILLLNPDSILIDQSIQKIHQKILKNKKIGVIGGKIYPFSKKQTTLTANSKPTFITAILEFTNLKKIFPNNFASKNFWIEKKYPQISKEIEVDSLCGAFMLFRKNHPTDKKLNLFDENYFLYLEDLDFCLEMRNKGYKVIFDPSAKIKHKSGASSGSKYNIVLKHWYNSRNYFFTKQLGRFQGKILSLIFSIEINTLSLYHHLRHETDE